MRTFLSRNQLWVMKQTNETRSGKKRDTFKFSHFVVIVYIIPQHITAVHTRNVDL